MKNHFILAFTLLAALIAFTLLAPRAATAASLSGTVYDGDGIALAQSLVKLLTASGNTLQQTTTSLTGAYDFRQVAAGDLQIVVAAPGYASSTTALHLAATSVEQRDITLKKEPTEMVLNVEAKRHRIKNSASNSSRDVNKEEIKALPQGETIKLPKLIATTTPGVVAGPFGQTFIRGNHANLQYQIDGVQLPDSPSNTFGEAFTPRNIENLEIITGGIPAEYGERLAAVVNITTKSGAETPGGEVELDYGSYNTASPFALYSGSNASGDLHYFLSAGFSRTERGLDTPQPQDETHVTQGDTSAVHDQAWGNNQFAKIDWLVDNTNKISFVAFNSYNYFQIPNFPASFSPGDPFFNPQTYADQFGNQAVNWTPSTTDDAQVEENTYLQIVWKRTLSEHSFLQLAPYYKYSYVGVKNDPNNDLAAAYGSAPIAGSTPSSFTESRPVNNYGLKGDYSARITEQHLLKAGLMTQASQASGGISVIAGQPAMASISSSDNSGTSGTFESVYVQDDFAFAPAFTLNVGVRFDATQFSFGVNPAVYSVDSLVQPRVGLNWRLTDTSHFHVFYGKLFQPVQADSLRDTFVSPGVFGSYDIKAEKDDYYETGLAQQWGDHVFSLNVYYKDATNMLDDTQLLNTSIAQPYNYARGFAYGTEFSVKGQITHGWSDYLNYSYEIAKGSGISGGLITGISPVTDWTYLDHVQLNTITAGVGYKNAHWWWTTQGLYGSGLRTGANNGQSLPGHFSADTTVGHEFTGENWYEKFKISVDILNITNNVYPITIANGFNGSHYAAGTTYFAHLVKEL